MNFQCFQKFNKNQKKSQENIILKIQKNLNLKREVVFNLMIFNQKNKVNNQNTEKKIKIPSNSKENKKIKHLNYI